MWFLYIFFIDTIVYRIASFCSTGKFWFEGRLVSGHWNGSWGPFPLDLSFISGCQVCSQSITPYKTSLDCTRSETLSSIAPAEYKYLRRSPQSFPFSSITTVLPGPLRKSNASNNGSNLMTLPPSIFLTRVSGTQASHSTTTYIVQAMMSLKRASWQPDKAGTRASLEFPVTELGEGSGSFTGRSNRRLHEKSVCKIGYTEIVTKSKIRPTLAGWYLSTL